MHVHKEGVELFSFPSRQITMVDKVEQKIKSEAAGDIGEQQHAEMKACLKQEHNPKPLGMYSG